MNETECRKLIDSVNWTEPSSLISLAILEFINVLVIGGNCLVIAAVFCSNKLRSVTNFFIVNLAVADLLVGLAVLPFSATWEVFKVWIFGDVWCRIWLAVDVWMCTASILNLCAISLDRYVAVTRPVTYPSIMSTKKAKSLIAGIWVLSFVICFPPLVGWKDQKATLTTYTRGNITLYSVTPSSLTRNDISDLNRKLHLINNTKRSKSSENFDPYDPSSETPLEEDESLSDIFSATTPFMEPSANATLNEGPQTNSMESSVENENDSGFFNGLPIAPPCPWKCELTNDRGYVLYSALGSFYIPMFVMLFFYWRIYRAAVRTTRAINQGFKTTKGSESGHARADDSQLILRIHRGRPCSTPQRTPLSVHSMSSTLSMNSAVDDLHPLQHPTSNSALLNSTAKRATSMRVNRQRHEKVAIKVSFPSSENVLEAKSTLEAINSPAAYNMVTTTGKTSFTNGGRRASFKSSLFEIGETTFNLDVSRANKTSHAPNSFTGTTTASTITANAPSAVNLQQRDAEASSLHTQSTKDKKRQGKRSAKIQVKRFRMETKAAKTLAIIVGGFIFCWLPFFTMYLIRAFCDKCIQPTVFSILFWLGYCNSAINPFIYALFSNEFRIAFKRIICRCVCTRSGFRASENFQMIAARALMAPATFHKTISGVSDEGDALDFS